MKIDESIDNILSLIDRGQVEPAIDAVDQAFGVFGSQAPYLVYAQNEIRYLAWRYKEAGTWKVACPTYAESLLEAAAANSACSPEISLALKHFGHLLRFLYRDQQSIPILETLMARECDDPQLWQFGYDPEGTWGLLAECYKETGSPDAAAKVKKKLAEQNVLFSDYWEENKVLRREVARKLNLETKEALLSGSLRPMPNSPVVATAHSPNSGEESQRSSPDPWWKFW